MSIIGCPKEIKAQENRVALTPQYVKILTKKHKVLVEYSAGANAGFSDKDYKDAGAVLKKASEIWKGSDIIIKVKEPLQKEYRYLKYLKNKILFTYLHLAAAPKKLTQLLIKHNVHAIAYETVEDKNNNLPLLEPMSIVAGILAVQYGAEYLQLKYKGRGITLSSVKGTDTANVVVLGSGTVGSNSIITAAGHGADVFVMQHTMSKVPKLRNAYKKALGSELIKNIHFIKATKANIAKYAKRADLMIGAVLVKGAKAPVLVDEKMVKAMKRGAVIVDVAIDQGGCIWGSRPTTHKDPVYHLHEKVYNCVANMPGQVAFQSTQALTHATYPYLKKLADDGIRSLKGGFAKGLNVSQGRICYKAVAESLDLEKYL